MPVSTCAHFRLLLLISCAISSLGVEKVHEHVVMRSAPPSKTETSVRTSSRSSNSEESTTASDSEESSAPSSDLTLSNSENSSGLPTSASSSSESVRTTAKDAQDIAQDAKVIAEDAKKIAAREDMKVNAKDARDPTEMQSATGDYARRHVGGTKADRDKQIEELERWKEEYDAEHLKKESSTAPGPSNSEESSTAPGPSNSEHPDEYLGDGANTPTSLGSDRVAEAREAPIEPTQIEGPCQGLAQNAKQVNNAGAGHSAGPSGVEILDAFEKCVKDVMGTMKPDLKKKTVAVQDANQEYLDAFNHIFYHLKRLKESELSEVFEKTHRKVWGELVEEATGLEATLKKMKLDKEGEQKTGSDRHEANNEYEDEAARMRGILRTDDGAGANNEANNEYENEAARMRGIRISEESEKESKDLHDFASDNF